MKLYEKFIKRGLDFLVALTLVIGLTPLFLIISLFIFLESGFPVFYKQRRVGRGLAEFGIVKFRSMVKNADKLGGYSTALGDPRITKLGRLLRKTSLDELPQLFNVLIGDMSLVGPRPDVPAQIEQYPSRELWKKRNSKRPGITGLAQVKGRSLATLEQRLAMDLHYIDHISLVTDLKIMAQTLSVVMASDQAT